MPHYHLTLELLKRRGSLKKVTQRLSKKERKEEKLRDWWVAGFLRLAGGRGCGGWVAVAGGRGWGLRVGCVLKGKRLHCTLAVWCFCFLVSSGKQQKRLTFPPPLGVAEIPLVEKKMYKFITYLVFSICQNTVLL